MTREVNEVINGETRIIEIEPPGGFELLYLIAECPEVEYMTPETVLWSEEVIYSCTNLKEETINELSVENIKSLLKVCSQEIVKKAKGANTLMEKMDSDGFIDLEDME